MRIMHPDLAAGVTSNVTDEQFHLLYRHRGWVQVGDLPDLDELTIPEATAQVGGDPAKALPALISERSGRNRSGLVRHLEQVLADSEPPADTPADVPTDNKEF